MELRTVNLSKKIKDISHEDEDTLINMNNLASVLQSQGVSVMSIAVKNVEWINQTFSRNH